MKIQRIIGITIISLAFAGTVMAQGAPQGQSSATKADLGPAYDSMDKNKDGKVTKEEWLAAGMSEDSATLIFGNQLDKDKDGSLTKAEFTGTLPPIELDTDKDGKVSLKEFVDATTQGAAAVSSGGQGGAPGGAPTGSTPPAQK